MGRKTFMTFPGPKALPNRVNIVITSDENWSAPDVIVCHSLDELLSSLADMTPTPFTLSEARLSMSSFCLIATPLTSQRLNLQSLPINSSPTSMKTGTGLLTLRVKKTSITALSSGSLHTRKTDVRLRSPSGSDRVCKNLGIGLIFYNI